MGLYEVTLSVCLLGIGIETMLANFHVWRSFKHIPEACESKRAYVF